MSAETEKSCSFFQERVLECIYTSPTCSFHTQAPWKKKEKKTIDVVLSAVRRTLLAPFSSACFHLCLLSSPKILFFFLVKASFNPPSGRLS